MNTKCLLHQAVAAIHCISVSDVYLSYKTSTTHSRLQMLGYCTGISTCMDAYYIISDARDYVAIIH